MAIAVAGHYAIGATLALVYLLASSALELSPRNPVTALVFALCTNCLPCFAMEAWMCLRKY